jgi:hypothetical protein
MEEIMKKRTFAILTLLVLGAGFLSAQEIPADMTPEQLEAAKAAYAAGKSPEEVQAAIAAAAPAAAPDAAAVAPAAPAPKPSVSTPLGELSIDGRVIAGAQAAWYHAYGEDYSFLGGMNAEMGESRAELAFHLKNGNFGEYIMIRAQHFTPNTGYYDGNYNPNNNTMGLVTSGNNAGANFAASIPYWLAYGNFFDNKVKVSVGKLYDENFVTRERVWKTEGSTKGGFYFSREGYPSIRLQFMPIQGLDIGGQLFFVNANSRYSMNLMGLANDDPLPVNAGVGESLKEWGLGASYTSGPFNAQLGVRLDSGVDPMNKYEAKTYLVKYYGDGDLMDPSSSAYFSYNPVAPHYKHWDKLSDVKMSGTYPDITMTATPKAFSDGTYAFAGFNLKAVKNLTFKVQGQLNNIPAFEEFGYGIFDETIGYQILPKFYAGVVLFQEFYGGDVFDDTKYANSPYFRFQPVVSYDLTSKIKATVVTTIGLCKDVLETPYFDIKPKLDFALASFGAMRAQIYYLFERAEFASYKGIDYSNSDYNKHEIGFSVDFMF